VRLASTFLWVVLPYSATVLFVAGHIWRYRHDKFGWTSRSTQLLEGRWLAWGSNLFHYGALAAIGGHVLGMLIPTQLTRAVGVSEPNYHLISAVAGSAAGIACVVGFVILVARRAYFPRVRRTTTPIDVATYVLLALLIGFPIPLVLAVIMSEARRFKGLYSALAYLPVVVPPVVAVLLWRFFFDARPTGVFNSILGAVGVGPLPWLQDSGTAMPSIVLEATWAGAGATVIIYLAALLSVPPELYDAAEVDGASIRQKIWHVTLPHLRGVLLITLILQLIATAQLFTEPFLFTGGGPANATITVLLLIYHYAFQNSLGGDYGMAAALSVMLAAFLGLFTGVYFWLTRSWSTT